MRIPKVWRWVNLALVTVLCTASMAFAQASDNRPRRAAHPDWSQDGEASVFFEDAFTEGLRGDRPNTAPAGTAQTAQQTDEQLHRWSDLISAATLEQEVKSASAWLRQTAREAGGLTGPAAVRASHRLRHVATLFVVIGNYDGDVRWQAQAAAMAERLHDLSSRLAKGEAPAAREASMLLDDLLRAALSLESVAKPSLGEIASRTAVMHRFEQSVKQQLTGALASARNLRRQSQLVVREAEVLATLARVLTHSGLDDAGDDDYVDYCEELVKQANDLRRYAEEQSHEKSTEVFTALQQSCTECHDMYRG